MKPLTGDAVNPEPVSMFRQVSGSLVSPVEHVSEQANGVFTKLAGA